MKTKLQTAMIIALAMALCAVSCMSCSVAAEEEDRDRLDELNDRLENTEMEIFQLRAAVTGLNVTLQQYHPEVTRMSGLDETLREYKESIESLSISMASLADSIEELVPDRGWEEE